jgi:hypothetical protein
MTTLKLRMRHRRDSARHAQALNRAMRSVDSRAVRNEVLSLLGH